MPLTVELFDDKENEYGRLIIDRNNLIIQILPKSNSKEDRGKASFKTEFARRLFQDYFGDIRSTLDIDDPMHFITDHVCESDKADHHYHLKFKQDIDLKMMLRILNQGVFGWLNLTSNDCYESLRGIITGYFNEQTSESKLSPPPADIESYYQQEKEDKFKFETDAKITNQLHMSPAGITNANREKQQHLKGFSAFPGIFGYQAQQTSVQWLWLTSIDWYKGLHGIIKDYFNKQTSASTLSPTPAGIESYYQKEKEDKFKFETDANRPKIADAKVTNQLHMSPTGITNTNREKQQHFKGSSASLNGMFGYQHQAQQTSVEEKSTKETSKDPFVRSLIDSSTSVNLEKTQTKGVLEVRPGF